LTGSHAAVVSVEKLRRKNKLETTLVTWVRTCTVIDDPYSFFAKILAKEQGESSLLQGSVSWRKMGWAVFETFVSDSTTMFVGELFPL